MLTGLVLSASAGWNVQVVAIPSVDRSESTGEQIIFDDHAIPEIPIVDHEIVAVDLEFRKFPGESVGEVLEQQSEVELKLQSESIQGEAENSQENLRADHALTPVLTPVEHPLEDQPEAQSWTNQLSTPQRSLILADAPGGDTVNTNLTEPSELSESPEKLERESTDLPVLLPILLTESSEQTLPDGAGFAQPRLISESPANTSASQTESDELESDELEEEFSNVSYSSQDLENPLIQVQGVYMLQGNDSSARLRVSGSYAITPNVMVGGTVDFTTGDAFSNSPEEGIDLNELYVAVSPTELPNLRFLAGVLDLTSYFDRNSFAKDAATHFFNPVFQSNPALTAAGLGSRPAILMNWSVADPVEVKIAGFSSSRDWGELALDGFVGEVGIRIDNLILRGTYITGRDAGHDDGFREIYNLARGEDQFGLDSDDREQAIGINAEYFIPDINLGLFARYGWYENLDLDRNSTTFSVGLNLLDLFMAEDRLGLAYGQQLSNSELRRDQDDAYPDVWELFYDFRITPHLRAGVTVQTFNQFSETIGGFRIRADFDSSDFGRLFQ